VSTLEEDNGEYVALDIPMFRTGGEDEYVIFLPGVRTDDVETLTYEVDEDEQQFRIYLVYERDEEGRPVGEMYPISLTDTKQRQLEKMQSLAVVNPRDQDPERLSEDPEVRRELRELFDRLEDLEDYLFEE